MCLLVLNPEPLNPRLHSLIDHITHFAQVLDGAGACPPEDSNGFEGMGNHAYQDFLDSVLEAKQGMDAKSQRKYRQLCAGASAGLNYKDR